MTTKVLEIEDLSAIELIAYADETLSPRKERLAATLVSVAFMQKEAAAELGDSAEESNYFDATIAITGIILTKVFDSLRD